MSKRKKIIKGIISYILTLFLAIFFALYLNATVGWFILVALILAFVLSVFFAFLTTLSVSVESKMEDMLLAKGDSCQMTVSIRNKSLFPTTPLEVVFQNGDGVKCVEKSLLVTVLPFEKKTFQVTFQAKISGPSVVGIEAVRATDYLGIFALKVRKISYEKLKSHVAVIPEIGDVSPRDDKILKVVQASCFGEDGDDTIEVSGGAFGGFPGYDHREYVPGDSLKRVNWKQSAKRGKLLIRLDDVLAAKAVNVVLDSAFIGTGVDMDTLSQSNLYKELPREDILAKLREDAVETALGIMKTLVFSSYSVTFFVVKEGQFVSYHIEDEKDIEAMRLQLAEYSFHQGRDTERFPKEEILDKQSSFLYCTPNDYKDVYSGLQAGEDSGRISIFSVIGDAIKHTVDKAESMEKKEKKNSVFSFFHKKKKSEKKEKQSAGKDTLKSLIRSLFIPYMLSLVSGVALFAVFRVSPLSVWTVLQAVVVFVVFAVCKYAGRHKIMGGVIIALMITVALVFFSGVAFSGIEYMQWFMSAADTIENTVSYLMTLIVIFTLLFSLVLYYYTQVYYRTSAILLVSIIPYVVYVKLIQEVSIGYVALTVVLNVAAFLINTRKQRDREKRIVAYRQGLLSVCVYAVCFIMIAFAVPMSDETKYYHFFEEWFLGGNTSVPLPEEYGDQSEYSGNADNFNQLSNRQLYNISGADMKEKLYVRRQVFDYYDFENHRWYSEKEYSKYQEPNDIYGGNKQYLSNERLLWSIKQAEELSPGFLEKYGMEGLMEAEYSDTVNLATVRAKNFESHYLISPTRTLSIGAYYNDAIDMNMHGIYGNESTAYSRNMSVDISYISEFAAKDNWIGLGASDMDYETSRQMLTELVDILKKHSKESYAAEAFLYEAEFAKDYANICKENTGQIPKSVRELALEITKDCTYDWQKAEALANYFRTEGYVYDLEYVAPDDSVEYFLFEGKTGTCSDYATAYVLMARAVGLTVRYVEGFVPEREISATYEWQYVVRTKNSHAYPEVYIENLGFMVYEPTVIGIGEIEMPASSGIMAYITTLFFRIVRVFAVVAAVIGLILVVTRIITPAIMEKRFLKKVLRLEYQEGIVLLYRRILEKQTSAYIKLPFVHTPFEYALKYQEIFGRDITRFIYLLEKAVYSKETVSGEEQKEAIAIYDMVKKDIKAYKKQERKKDGLK